jgi:hypothetical protein
MGCNRQSESTASKGGRVGGDVAARPAPATEAVTASQPEVVAGSSAATESDPAVRADQTEITPAEFLPPDVATTVSEIAAAPGSVIEVRAEGSSDVVAMTLSDGRTAPTDFRYDDVEGLWRAAYRVPLRPTSDRIGLSITAKNATSRWRRVWVFVKPHRETASADSSDGR